MFTSKDIKREEPPTLQFAGAESRVRILDTLGSERVAFKEFRQRVTLVGKTSFSNPDLAGRIQRATHAYARAIIHGLKAGNELPPNSEQLDVLVIPQAGILREKHHSISPFIIGEGSMPREREVAFFRSLGLFPDVLGRNNVLQDRGGGHRTILEFLPHIYIEAFKTLEKLSAPYFEQAVYNLALSSHYGILAPYPTPPEVFSFNQSCGRTNLFAFWENYFFDNQRGITASNQPLNCLRQTEVSRTAKLFGTSIPPEKLDLKNGTNVHKFNICPKVWQAFTTKREQLTAAAFKIRQGTSLSTTEEPAT